MVIKEESVDLDTPTGPMRTYVYQPAAAGKYAGLVLFSEIFQQTGPIKRSAVMLAGHGFIVAVPEIFHELEAPGTVLGYDTPGADRGNADKIGKELASYDADARAVIACLKSHPNGTGKVGAVGFCIGGHLSYRASMNADVLAGACFYATDIHSGTLGKGKQDDSLARTTDLRGEMLMVWGRQDPHVPDDGRAVIYNRLREAGVNFTWHEFNAAHAFMRDEGPRFDPALALQGYRMMVDLFHRKLR